EFFGIPSGKLRRYFSLKNISDVFKIFSGYFAALKILKREKPQLLFSKGGFVSVPPCAAAKFLKIPVFTHESDFSPGLATRINSRFAEKIFTSYFESSKFYKKNLLEKIRISGNPVRPEFLNADPAKGRAFLGLKKDETILLVLGGSQGSGEINRLISASLPELTRNYTVVHQTGETIQPSAKIIEHYRPFAYFKDELPHIIAASQLVISRSGAGTIWECKSLKKPMVLIPFRGSGTRGDQVENARLFEEAGAAVCFYGDEQKRSFGDLITSLLENPERLKKMGEAEIAHNNAAKYIAEEIIQRIGE
ncbi:MAG: UDP-N-acetylglucosamine--N-acetylmuramyl-(pentapeptide) pyrophosphoryl-undecaprenol N-acetylglucosamine transferase, partial [Treponema sp.]|nr:UDP-N-acetylglucosamine--N-acetylmuramyl-(pentapeptide) pyrophosphoryl-undecaprenol N-acetylglucosamine transferase [Treponema sp.]